MEVTQDDLTQLSQEELVQMVLALYHQNEALQAAMTELKADNEALRLKLEKGQETADAFEQLVAATFAGS